jgi:hypothetical protein
MTTYYTYRSFEEFDSGRSYIGVRKCPGGKTPETDSYLGSYTDKTFSPTAKEILGVYYSKEEALQAEIDLHKEFDVARNPHFSNRACATSTGFSYGMTGRKHTEETKRKMSEAHKGEKNANYGKQHTEERKKLMFKKFSGEGGSFYGKKHTKESKRKISKANSGKTHTEETKRKISKGQTGEKNHMHGKKHSNNSKKKMSESQKSLNRLGEKHPGYKPRDWCHTVYGEIMQKSITDLINMFPDDKLEKGLLSLVANGKRFSHKGWKILINKNASIEKRRGKLRDWSHPIHGKVFGKSASEMVALFPEQKLRLKGLSQVATGDRTRHKGWEIC